MKKPVEVFDDWARADKDKGMEKGHRASVDAMLKFALQDRNTPFRFIDAGCGNGWVKRLVEQNPNCSHAQGVDGAVTMIRKAKSIDPKGDYTPSRSFAMGSTTKGRSCPCHGSCILL